MRFGPTPGVLPIASMSPDEPDNSDNNSTEVEDDDEDVPLSEVYSTYCGKLGTIRPGRTVPKVATRRKKAKPSGLSSQQDVSDQFRLLEEASQKRVNDTSAH
jgi:hypothetical protein